VSEPASAPAPASPGPVVLAAVAAPVALSAVVTANPAVPAIHEQNKPLAPVQSAQHAINRGATEALPAGQRLSVVSMPGASPISKSNQPAALTDKEQEASVIEAFEVRLQADSARESASNQPHPIAASLEGDFWYATVQALIAAESITAMVRELALQSQLVARDTDQWLLRVERESLNQSGSRERLANALAGIGYPVRLAAEVGRVTDSPAKRNAANAAQAQLTAEKIVFDDPFVQSLMRDFGAKIVPGSIKPQ